MFKVDIYEMTKIEIEIRIKNKPLLLHFYSKMHFCMFFLFIYFSSFIIYVARLSRYLRKIDNET